MKLARLISNLKFACLGLVIILLAGFPGRALGTSGLIPAPPEPPYRAYLPLVSTPDRNLPLAGLLTPFDVNASDLVGPSSWAANYGKIPEIIVASNGVALDVLAQDYDPTTPWQAVLLHIEPGANGYQVTQALTGFPMLDRVMGLASDPAGNRYYATAVDESALVDPNYPPLDTYRTDIVRVVKLDPTGGVIYNIDLDVARHDFNPNAEAIINPMTFGSARLAVGGGELALVHSINTDPDWNIGGARHQKALSTRLDAASGAVTRTSSVWVSHSFDQRLLYDGQGIIENHLGDAFPRTIVFGREHVSYRLFAIKGPLGENNTYTRLGNLARIENDPDYGYLGLFVTESSAGYDVSTTINGPRNLAIVRVRSDDNSLDPALPDSLTVDFGRDHGHQPAALADPVHGRLEPARRAAQAGPVGRRPVHRAVGSLAEHRRLQRQLPGGLCHADRCPGQRPPASQIDHHRIPPAARRRRFHPGRPGGLDDRQRRRANPDDPFCGRGPHLHDRDLALSEGDPCAANRKCSLLSSKPPARMSASGRWS